MWVIGEIVQIPAGQSGHAVTHTEDFLDRIPGHSRAGLAQTFDHPDERFVDHRGRSTRLPNNRVP